MPSNKSHKDPKISRHIAQNGRGLGNESQLCSPKLISIQAILWLLWEV